MNFKSFFVCSMALTLPTFALAQDYSSGNVGEEFFNEAESILSASQSQASDPSDWGMRQKATKQMNDITIPKGEWPLKDLGVPEPGDHPYNLYILVSENLSDELIRAYAYDAIQTGGQLIVRGMRADEGIQEATKRWSKVALRSDGASPGVSIDPRPFSAFDVDVVPAIVLSKKPIKDLCEQTKSKFSMTHETAGDLGTLDYATCMRAPESSYYKISGNVSVPWALKSMSQFDAEPVLQATAKAWFDTTPDRYGVDASAFGYSDGMTEEQFMATGDKDGFKEWLKSIRPADSAYEVIKTKAGYGLGLKGQEED